MDIPEDLFYSKEHEWASFQAEKAVIGISDFAQSSLGDITFVELPKEGALVKQFSCCASVESVKAASDVYSPVTGKVIKVNKELESRPELINSSPYKDGWIAVVAISNDKDKAALMSPGDYRKFLENSK